MVFSNLIFLYLFLPLNLVLYFISKNKAYRNAVLIGFSLFFYAWGEPVWITLLLFSATIDYIHGLIIQKHPKTIYAKLAVVSSLVLNLGLLGIFKYGSFFVANINALTGLEFAIPTFSLPIGISFYTFQTISYTIDVYRGQVGAQRSYGKFLLYVSLYPQLVAGPIVRYSEVAAEIDNRSISSFDLSEGLHIFCAGLAKKVLVANVAGGFASKFLDGDLSLLSVGGAWFGILMYTLQIYYDFSGYSDMAIGLARIFGFHYNKNFNYPYISKNITEFWRRWHISLGSFFRDYVYIPMGGNRRHQYLNLIIVWFLTGFWHGASWNFVLWGLYYGALVMLEKRGGLKLLAKLPVLLQRLYTGFFVVIGWAIFYFVDFSRLGQFFGILFGFSGAPLHDLSLNVLLFNNIFWLILAVLFVAPITVYLNTAINHYLKPHGRVLVRSLQILLDVAIILLCTSGLVGQSYNPFLYFRF